MTGMMIAAPQTLFLKYRCILSISLGNRFLLLLWLPETVDSNEPNILRLYKMQFTNPLAHFVNDVHLIAGLLSLSLRCLQMVTGNRDNYQVVGRLRTMQH